MGLFKWRSVVRGIAVTVMTTAVAASMTGAAEAKGSRHPKPKPHRHFLLELDPGEGTKFHRLARFPVTLCVARDDSKPGESGELRLAVDDVPGSVSTLRVDDEHPVACTEYKPRKHWSKFTATNISDIELKFTRL